MVERRLLASASGCGGGRDIFVTIRLYPTTLSVESREVPDDFTVSSDFLLWRSDLGIERVAYRA